MSDEKSTKNATMLKRVTSSKMMLVLTAVSVIAMASAIYFYVQLNSLQSRANADQQLVTQVGETVQVPTGETPMVVTVENKANLTNKLLANKVDDGDKLIIYSANKRIIVYRPSVKKVVDMLTFAAASDVPTK